METKTGPQVPTPRTADERVEAERIYRSALRAGLATRLSFPRAVLAARALALRDTGIDWFKDLGINPEDIGSESTLSVATSVGRWFEKLAGGELPYDLIPGLTTDWYEIYLAWCEVNREHAVPMRPFVRALLVECGVVRARKRYMLEGGEFVGPHTVLFLEKVPAGETSEPAWLGRCIKEVKGFVPPASILKRAEETLTGAAPKSVRYIHVADRRGDAAE